MFGWEELSREHALVSSAADPVLSGDFRRTFRLSEVISVGVFNNFLLPRHSECFGMTSKRWTFSETSPQWENRAELVSCNLRQRLAHYGTLGVGFESPTAAISREGVV